MAHISYTPPGAKLLAFRRSDHPLRALIGPLHAGRKSCCFNDILGRAVDRRYHRQLVWRWVVVRPEREELDAYTIPCVRGWLGNEHEFDPRRRVLKFNYNLGDGHDRLLEMRFLAMDEAGDRRRLPSLEASGVWLDDARHLSESVLEDALAIAGSYPSSLHGGPVWSGVIISSRMPVPMHWLVNRADIELFRQPGGRSPEAENLQHLARLGFSYDRLAARRHPDFVRVEIDAELGASAEEQQGEEHRAAVRASLEKWVATIMPDLTPAAHHRLLIETLERLASGTSRRVMFFLPPGSAKSTYGSIAFPSWYLGNHPTHSVIAASHAKELAERFGRRVRNIVGSPVFGDTFGFGLSGESGAAGRWETNRGGEYYAVGVDASVTGRRADLGIIDDPVKGRSDADSPTVREHAWQWYKADFWTRLKPNAIVLYIGTRWHEDDLAGRLLREAEEGGEQWEVVNLPMLAKEDDPLGRAPGERLWADWFTPEMVTQAQRDPRNWSALYQQEPMPEGGEYFKAEWFRYYDKLPPRDTLRFYGASDYAVRNNQAADYTVHLVVGVDPNDDIYLTELWRDQKSPDVWVEALLDLMARWKTITWAEEMGQIEKGVGPFVTKRQLERKIYGVRRQYSSSLDKAARAQPIRGRAAMGKVLLPRNAPWVINLLQELLRFPAGTHDDQVDTLGLIGRMLDEMIPGSKPKPKPSGIIEPQALTLDEIIRLTGPGGKYGPPLRGPFGGRPQRI